MIIPRVIFAPGERSGFSSATETAPPNQPPEHNAYDRHASCGAAVAPTAGMAQL
jgi:hypothetical protein